MIVVNNKEVQACVRQRKEFKTTDESLFGVECWSGATRRYVVLSYGDHYPLFIYEWTPDAPDDGAWYENITPAEGPTNKHRTLAHPLAPCTPMTGEQMALIISGGLVHMVMETSKY